MTRRRSTTSVTLVLIGASALTACGPSSTPQSSGTMRRDMYATQADCMQDWGADPTKCEQRQTRSGSTTTSRFYGPAYSHGAYGSNTRSTHAEGSTSEARPGSRAIGTSHVSRSGFGSSSSSHSSSSARSSSSGS